MATGTGLLTLEEFHSQFGNEHGWEYCFGNAVRKGLPTTLHGVMQFVLMLLVNAQKCKAGSEIDLRIDPDWEPRPDVLISSKPFERPYPTKPTGLLVIEIVSPDDTLPKMREKCANYSRIGIEKIFVVDPDHRTIRAWLAQVSDFAMAEAIQLPNDTQLNALDIWTAFDNELAQ